MAKRERTSVLMAVVAVVAAIVFAFALTGCKESDSIVERIYDQTSKNVDYDNPDKIYIADKNADLTVEELKQTLKDQQKQDQVKKDLPSKSGDEQNQPVDRPEYSDSASSAQTAPSAVEGNGKKRTDTSGKSNKNTKKKKKSGKGGSSSKGGEGDSPSEGNETGTYSVDPDDDTYQKRTYDSTYGKTKDLPSDVKTVVATGELATITQMLGNKGALIGSAEDYLGQQSVQKVFKGKGVASVKKIWSGDGETTKDAEAKKIVDAKPDALVVFPGQITAKQERMIAQNCKDLVVITLPKPTSVSNIETEVKAIGQLLSDGTDGASATKAQEYLDFVDDIVSEAKDAHGGGLVTYSSIDYGKSDALKTVTTKDLSSKEKWTLYIDGWDDDAKVEATYQSKTLFEDMGAAYTNIGWWWSPLSYYMSAGGVINNGAAYGSLSTDTQQPVLTLNENQVSYKWSDFCVDVDESRGGGSFTRFRAFYTLTNARSGVDASATDPSAVHALGSSDFNSVIVKTKDIKKSLAQAKKNDNGLYTMYGLATTASERAYGRKVSGSKGDSIVYSTVRGDAGYDILVNPCGYVGSWTDGSIESPLESLWVASQYWGYSESDLEARINEFYDKFYDGYAPDVSKILDGSYAE